MQSWKWEIASVIVLPERKKNRIGVTFVTWCGQQKLMAPIHQFLFLEIGSAEYLIQNMTQVICFICDRNTSWILYLDKLNIIGFF